MLQLKVALQRWFQLMSSHFSKLNLLLGTECQAGFHLPACQPSVLTVLSSFALTKFAADTHLLLEPAEFRLILQKSTPNLLPTLLHFPAIFPLVTAHKPQPPQLIFFPHHPVPREKNQNQWSMRHLEKAEIKESPSPL